MASLKCTLCKRDFGSTQSLAQHLRDKHNIHSKNRKNKGHESEHDHSPPFEEAEGYWVPRRSFEGKKSFGHFQCGRCSKLWTSAHAFARFKQGCQRCEYNSLPCCLWVNTDDYRSERSDDDEDKAPHDSGRCEACRLGQCRQSFYFAY